MNQTNAIAFAAGQRAAWIAMRARIIAGLPEDAPTVGSDYIAVARTEFDQRAGRNATNLVTTLRDRLALLAPIAATNESVAVCVEDAEACLNNADHGMIYPLNNEEFSSVPVRRERDAALWIASAERWIERAAQHAWGFTRPASWTA